MPDANSVSLRPVWTGARVVPKSFFRMRRQRQPVKPAAANYGRSHRTTCRGPRADHCRPNVAMALGADILQTTRTRRAYVSAATPVTHIDANLLMPSSIPGTACGNMVKIAGVLTKPPPPANIVRLGKITQPVPPYPANSPRPQSRT